LRRIEWRALALDDRDAIMAHIARDNPVAAIKLDEAFEAKAEQVRQRPTLYRPGRVPGTREAVVRPSYVMVYRYTGDAIEILRVLHAMQRWP
jgi:toxin ParE1/3/4